MTPPPTLKLTYFDSDGRAAVIRKTFSIGGLPFIDERVSKDQFQQLQPSLPYGKLPVLAVDGVVVAESQAILRYAGRVTGLYPPASEPLAAALVDEVLDSFDDVFERTLSPSFVEKDAEKSKLMREQLLKGPLPHAIAQIQKRLQQLHAYSYFQNDRFRVGLLDVVVWDYVVYIQSGEIEHIPPTFLDAYETLIAMYDKVEAAASGAAQQRIVTETPPSPLPRTLKLSYFDLPFRAEHIRLACHMGGIAFDDERLSWGQVITRRPEFPNEQVPVLLIDGVTTLAQSMAILRYVGTLTGLYAATDPLRAMQIDEVLSYIGDLYFACLPSLAESDPVKSKAMRAQLATSTIPEALERLDKRLQHTQTDQSKDVMGRDMLTIADLGIYNLVLFFKTGFLRHVPATIADKSATILKISEAVQQHPRVKDWYATHTAPTM